VRPNSPLLTDACVAAQSIVYRARLTMACSRRARLMPVAATTPAHISHLTLWQRHGLQGREVRASFQSDRKLPGVSVQDVKHVRSQMRRQSKLQRSVRSGQRTGQ